MRSVEEDVLYKGDLVKKNFRGSFIVTNPHWTFGHNSRLR